MPTQPQMHPVCGGKGQHLTGFSLNLKRQTTSRHSQPTNVSPILLRTVK